MLAGMATERPRRRWPLLLTLPFAVVLAWVIWHQRAPARAYQFRGDGGPWVPVAATPGDLAEVLRLRGTFDGHAINQMIDEGRVVPADDGARAGMIDPGTWPRSPVRVRIVTGLNVGREGYAEASAVMPLAGLPPDRR
jgi:hypothetical protein